VIVCAGCRRETEHWTGGACECGSLVFDMFLQPTFSNVKLRPDAFAIAMAPLNEAAQDRERVTAMIARYLESWFAL
jgi:hypothetical protein